MKKLMLVLLVATITAPAMADVTIAVVENGGWTADITYTCTGDAVFDICADFDRAEQGTIKTGIYRVSFADLTILLNNWQDDTNVTGECGGLINP